MFLLRKISKFVTGGPVDTYLPIPVFTCSKCSTVHQGSLAPELKTVLNATEDPQPEVIEELEEKPQAKVIQMF